MAIKSQPLKRHSQAIKSLADLGSLTGTSVPADTNVPAADVQDVQLQALDANSAHVVVTLRAEEATVSTVAPTNFGTASAAPIPQPVPEPQKEDTMTATTIESAAPVTSAAPAAAPVTSAAPAAAPVTSAAPAAAPVAPVATPTAAAQRFGFNPDFSFLDNPVALNKRLHDLSNASNATNDRVDTLEDRMRRIESGGVGFGRTVISEDTSVEAIAYKVGTAALVGAAAYTGVKLASWLLDSGTPAGE